MIARMKKVTIVTTGSDVSRTLESLRDLGVVHVIPVTTPLSKEVEALKGNVDLIEKTLNGLSQRRGPVAAEGSPRSSPLSAVETANNYRLLVERRNKQHERLLVVEKEIDRLKALGNFSKSDFQYLKQNGIKAGLYRTWKKQLSRTRIPVHYAIVGREGSIIYVMAFSDGDFELPFEEAAVPDKALSSLKEELKALEEKIKNMDLELDRCRAHLGSLRDGLTLMRGDLELAEAAAGMGREGEISYLQGYIPAEDQEELKAQALKKGWGLVVADPTEGADVPTLIKNPAWIRIVEPVLRFMGTVPGYEEFDVSFWFLISLVLFFAMIVGDGGYGIIFLIGTFAARRRFKSAEAAPFVLLYVFSGATILWGLVTGTWFGVQSVSELPLLGRFIIPQLNSFGNNQDFMIHLSFTLGVAHLTIAHLIRGVRRIKSVRILAELGWIMILWFLYYAASYLVLGKPMPEFGTPLLLGGVALVGLFASSQKGFIKSFLLGFLNLPFDMIKSFSDLVSYLRLFAVGYATFVIAVSFNEMASSLGDGSFLGSLGFFLVLLIGHTLNFLLASMAVLVHGVRLVMLEFSSHLGMSWSGRLYSPFRRRTA